MKFRLYEVLMFVLLVSVCLALISPVYRFMDSVTGGKQRVAKRLNHEAIRDAGRILLANVASDENFDVQAEIPQSIAKTKPTQVSIRDGKLYLEYGNASATYGLVIVDSKTELETLAPIIDGVYYYESTLQMMN